MAYNIPIVSCDTQSKLLESEQNDDSARQVPS